MSEDCSRKLPRAILVLVAGMVVGVGCGSARSGLLFARDAGASASEGGSGGQGTGGEGGATSPGTKADAGGKTSSGGRAGQGGVTGMGGTAGPGGSDSGVTAPAVPTVSESGYVTVSAGTTVLTGFISSSTAGSGSSIALTYGASNFCASGTVAANSTYKSWANAGFSVNQDQSGASGSSASLVLTGSSLSIGYVNRGGSQLEFQLYDGSNYWCYILPPSSTPGTATIPFSSLNTQCWDGRGSSFTSGTAIRTVNLVVPGGNASATPFDFCLLGLTIN